MGVEILGFKDVHGSINVGIIDLVVFQCLTFMAVHFPTTAHAIDLTHTTRTGTIVDFLLGHSVGQVIGVSLQCLGGILVFVRP